MGTPLSLKHFVQLLKVQSCCFCLLQGCSPEVVPLQPQKPTHSKVSTSGPALCSQLCASFKDCAGEPNHCANVCLRESQRLKTEFLMSLTQCVRQELEDCSVYSTTRSEIQKQKLSICYAATLKAYAQLDDGHQSQHVLEAICQRLARCSPEQQKETICLGHLRSSLPPAFGAILFSVRPEIISKVVSCIKQSDCSDQSWQRCMPQSLSMQSSPK